MNNYKRLDDIQPIEMLNGIYRRTLCFNKDLMLCHFILEKDSEIPMHKHKESQVGYVIKGKMMFLTKDKNFMYQRVTAIFFNQTRNMAQLY